MMELSGREERIQAITMEHCEQLQNEEMLAKIKEVAELIQKFIEMVLHNMSMSKTDIEERLFEWIDALNDI